MYLTTISQTLQTTLAETLARRKCRITSVIKIREHVPTGSVPSVPFVFKPISERQVDKYITSIGKKKATGLDDLSAKVLKIIKKPYLCHLTRMINRMFEDSTFPKHMKNARITPLYKKEDPVLKKILSTCKCITSLLPLEASFAGRGALPPFRDALPF